VNPHHLITVYSCCKSLIYTGYLGKWSRGQNLCDWNSHCSSYQNMHYTSDKFFCKIVQVINTIYIFIKLYLWLISIYKFVSVAEQLLSSWTFLKNLGIATLSMWLNFDPLKDASFNYLNKLVSTSCFDHLTFDLSTPSWHLLVKSCRKLKYSKWKKVRTTKIKMPKSKKNSDSAYYNHYVEKSDVNDQNSKSQNWSELQKSTYGL
jgi:hypothetical protein